MRLRVGLGARQILESVVIAFCAGDEFVLSRIRMQKVVLKTEKQISELPFVFNLVFRTALYLIEYAFPPIAWKFRRFTRMPLERQMEYLHEWMHSPFAYKRNLFKLVKAICVSQIFSEHKLLEGIGYGPALEHRKKSPGPQASGAP